MDRRNGAAQRRSIPPRFFEPLDIPFQTPDFLVQRIGDLFQVHGAPRFQKLGRPIAQRLFPASYLHRRNTVFCVAMGTVTITGVFQMIIPAISIQTLFP